MKKFEDYTIKEALAMGYTIHFHGPKGQKFSKKAHLHLTQPTAEEIKNVWEYFIDREVKDLKKDIEI